MKTCSCRTAVRTFKIIENFVDVSKKLAHAEKLMTAVLDTDPLNIIATDDFSSI